MAEFDREIVPLQSSAADSQIVAFQNFMLREICRVFSGRRTEARDCVLCNGTGSVDPSERVIDWSKLELGFTREEVNPQLVVCPACRGSGKETRHGTA